MATAAPKKETTPPTPAAPEAVPAAAPAPAPVAKAGFKAWIPTIVALVVAPGACWAVATFVLVPQLRHSLQADLGVEETPAAPAAPAKAEGGHGKGGHGAKGAEATAGNVYRFENVVVNLAGTMGTRYLKTTFLVTGSQPDLVARFEAGRPQLLDITIAVLSSLTLHDLEEPGAKNVIREKLVNSYNQALGQRVAEQVYFSDFVVQ